MADHERFIPGPVCKVCQNQNGTPKATYRTQYDDEYLQWVCPCGFDWTTKTWRKSKTESDDRVGKLIVK